MGLVFESRNILVVIAILFSCLPLIFGFPVGSDWGYELVRVVEYGHALADGQLPPFWANNLYHGYGSPIFLFYAPLFMLVANGWSALLGSMVWGVSIAILFFTAVSAFFVVGMVHSLVGGNDTRGRTTARVASYLYLLNAYLIGDKFLRNANAEFTALCVAPLAFWGLFALRTTPRRGVWLLAAGVCLIVISHNLTALSMVMLLVYIGLVLYPPYSDRKRFIYVGSGILLGLLMSSFFWMPALLLKSLVQIDQITTNRFDFHLNFPPVEWLFGYKFYAIGVWPLLLLAIAFIGGGRISSTLERPLRGLFLATGAATVMLLLLQTQSTMWLWEQLPMLPLFQFPWRMMGPLALMITIIGGLMFSQMARGWDIQRIRMMEVLVLLLSIANAVPHLATCTVINNRQEVEGLIKRGIPATISATVMDEYLPKGVKQPLEAPASIIVTDQDAQVQVLVNTPMRLVFGITADEPVVVHIARWVFPIWEASINGTAAMIHAGRLQNIDLSIPAGHNEVTLIVRPPLLRTIGVIVSIFAILLWMMILLWKENGWPQCCWFNRVLKNYQEPTAA